MLLRICPDRGQIHYGMNPEWDKDFAIANTTQLQYLRRLDAAVRADVSVSYRM